MRKIDWDRVTGRAHRREIQRARESEFDAREDRIAEAIRDGALGPVSWALIDLLTDPDMEMLRGMHISWR